MKPLPITLSALLLLAVSLAAQERAVTDSGKKILVFPDGTWKQEATDSGKEAKAGTAFSRPATATAKAAIHRGKSAIFYDPKKWKPKGPEASGRSEFEHVDGDGYAVVITERLTMSMDALRKVALSNAKDAAPDAEIVFEEKRRVNGSEVLVLKIKGTIDEIPFFYYGYYYSGKEGIIQAITYTGQNLFDEYKPEFELFLNGLVINP
jgi:hypothetical protein